MPDNERLRNTDQHLIGLILIGDEQITCVQIVGAEEHWLRRSRDRHWENSLAFAHGWARGLRHGGDREAAQKYEKAYQGAHSR